MTEAIEERPESGSRSPEESGGRGEDGTVERSFPGGRIPPGPASESEIDVRSAIGEREERIGEEWVRWILSRGGSGVGASGELLAEFVSLLVRLVRAALGPHREDVEPVWHEASNLYGSLGAMRGLAAGEVLEEFQFLREALIRSLYASMPGGPASRAALRDILRLNRVVDTGVTEASVGHTDALFFALFRGDGVPEPLTEELVGEVRDQIDALWHELESVAPGSGR